MCVQPHVEVFRFEHQGNALGVDMTEPGMWWQGNDGKCRKNIALEVPELVEACKSDSVVNGMDVVTLLIPFLSGPFVEAAGRDDGSLGMKPLFPEWAGSQAPRSGVEGAVLWRGAVAAALGFGFDEK